MKPMVVPKLEINPKNEMILGIMRWILQMITALALFGSILFLAAGRLDWFPGWAYLGLNALTQLISAVVLIPRQPAMIAERSQVREGTKSWDRVLAPAVAMAGPLAIMVTAGLDVRFGLSTGIGTSLCVAGFAIAFGCQLFVLWAMASNPFFAMTVRIQSERGQEVIQHGPYQLVRHPGYLGAVLFGLACPLALGSWWAFIPSLLTSVLIVVRTHLEDKTLQTELPGYREYASVVRYKLFPGIW
jgi:protein-S-isoprenylcysteine O-methyltransferase Ste14